MELNVFSQIGILIGVATLMALLMRYLRQPLIIGHIITGFLVGRLALGLFQEMEMLELFSELGISFLLFTVGLTLNPRVLRDYGLAAVLSCFGQVALTGTTGILVCLALGYGLVTALYVGIALAFSSTVIVMKLLSDKGDLDKLYVKISIGSLLLQDLIAIALLFAIPFATGAQGTGSELIYTLAYGLIAGVTIFFLSHYVIRSLNQYLSQSQELLFLFAVSWGMGIAALFAGLGFSLEGGALIAGVALSTLPSRHEIGARLAPLRDFFIVAFFILLGSRMVVSDFSAIFWPAAILSLFVLIGNPLLQLVVMGALGYRKKTGFQTGTLAAQISEFSLILVALGVSLGQVAPSVLSTVTLVGIITIFISSYLILYSDALYKHAAPYLTIFERKNVREKRIRRDDPSAIIIGGGRIAFDFIKFFSHDKQEFFVIDHDPEVIRALTDADIPAEYGDANDPDLLVELRVNDAEIVVSTTPDMETNLLLLSTAKRAKKSPAILCVAHGVSDALELYNAGADYVILPHFLGGSFAARLVRRYTKEALDIQNIRDEHIKHLQARISAGHEYPRLT